jgi:hypothetical protein
MNLKNFKNDISSAIYERGYAYYNDGSVLALKQLKNGKWIAEVEGNYGEYRVEVKLDNNLNIENRRCSCPFDGIICKHVVAVLLSIEEKLQSGNSSNKPEMTESEWKSIIENTDETKLRMFLMEYADAHQEFRDELIIHLSESSGELDIGKYQNIIANSFDAMAGRYGYIDYHHTHVAISPVYDLLYKAEEYISGENYYEAFSIAAAVAPECIEKIEYFDDSNGELGEAISQAFEITDKILGLTNDKNLSDEIFDWLLEQANNKDYDDYGCGDELEPIFFKWAVTDSRIEKAYAFIEQQLVKNSDSDGWTSRYRTTKYLKYKTDLLLKEGKEESAAQLINNNIHLSEFRKIKIDLALGQNDYPQAILHIKEGILQAEKDKLAGVVHQFKDQLLDIYKKLNDKNNIRQISRELFLDNRSSINYYRLYKSTFENAEWEHERESIIRKLSENRTKSIWDVSFQSDLASVFVEEKMWGNLLSEIKQSKNINIVERYSKYLINDYPKELIEIYKESILKYAVNTGRNYYADIVGYLKNMAKIKGGETIAVNLMNELLEKYKNRPAMKEEFKKLNWD